MGKIVAKFGGSSLSDAGQFVKVRQIIEMDTRRCYVVPSAPGKRFDGDEKVTDLLYRTYRLHQEGKDFTTAFSQVRERFVSIATELGLKVDIISQLNKIESDLLAGASEDYCASRGEYLNGLLLADYLGYHFLDPKDYIFFSEDGAFDSERTNDALSAVLAHTDRAVIPGFYGSGADGRIRTFSRGGSDVSGAIVARAAYADLYENWTDVSGFLMADPTIVKNPKGITHITYSELRELSYMGASVLHEEAIFPVKEANIPIHILNTNRPQDAGTIIQEHSKVKSGYPITGIAGKKDFMSIYVYKKHMSNEVGFIRKALSILEKYHISIEHIPSGIDSFNIVVEKKEIEESLYEILAHFKDELKPDKLTVQEDLALISTVGKNMSDKPGTSGKLFGALGKNNINIVMIAQGSDEINITVGVKKKDFTKTVQVIYDTFVGGNEE